MTVEQLCPRCFWSKAQLDLAEGVGVCPSCGPIRKVQYSYERSGLTKIIDYWRKVERRPPRKKDSNAECLRCGGNRNLETDHIKPRAEGGLDDDDNLRDLCVACHDYRHARDSILKNIRKLSEGNEAQLTMWIFRLGVLEMLNTPELVRQRGYTPYWDMPETHYSRWYENIKIGKKGSDKLQKVLEGDVLA